MVILLWRVKRSHFITEEKGYTHILRGTRFFTLHYFLSMLLSSGHRLGL